MHELSILYQVVEKVLKIVEENKLSEVEAIVLQVGELSNVIPRYLQACYPAAVDGTLLQKTQLELEILPARVICRSCSQVASLADFDRGCPCCGEDCGEIISGREFTLKEIRAR